METRIAALLSWSIVLMMIGPWLIAHESGKEPAAPNLFVLQAGGERFAVDEDGTLMTLPRRKGPSVPLIRATTSLHGCTNSTPSTRIRLGDGSLQIRRQVVHGESGRSAWIVDRFLPEKNSLRWEVEVQGTGEPWSTGIETHLVCSQPEHLRFWTAWADPDGRRDRWQDPLSPRPFQSRRLFYGTSPWSERRHAAGYEANDPNRFFIPLATVLKPSGDRGMSLALSPDNPLLEVSLSIDPAGVIAISRNDLRLSAQHSVSLRAHLIPHEADWRPGMAWLTQAYPEYFHSPNSKASEITGLGAYSDWEGELQATKLKRMGFRLNWKASYDFPYMGMFLPNLPEAEEYPRFLKGNRTSLRQMAAYSQRMRALGFGVLNYFNVTEFGGTTGLSKSSDPSLPQAEQWKNPFNMLEGPVRDGVLHTLDGQTYPSWEGCIAMDCGGTGYRAFLLEQARRHVKTLSASAGICIDRMDWLKLYNFEADDGISWRANRPCRSLLTSWRSLMGELGPLFHEQGKVIFANPLVNRTDALRHVDGIYHEFGQDGTDLNGAALQCVFKPCIAWTPSESALTPNPDTFFQRHLYLGVFPTAPLPANDRTIHPSPRVDSLYLDYGPLFDQLRGRRWVLQPRRLELLNGTALLNLFETPSGFAIPVMMAGSNHEVSIRFRPPRGLPPCRLLFDVLLPGNPPAIPLLSRYDRGNHTLRIPIRRGCAMVLVRRLEKP